MESSRQKRGRSSEVSPKSNEGVEECVVGSVSRRLSSGDLMTVPPPPYQTDFHSDGYLFFRQQGKMHKKPRLSDSDECSSNRDRKYSGSSMSLYPEHWEPCKLYTDQGHEPTHYEQLLENLQSPDDMQVLSAVCQLSMDLAVAQEDLLTSFPIDQCVPLLINCLYKEDLPDIILYAMISLTHLMDALPNVANLVASTGGVSAICSKLTNIEFIDMAEHAIKALEKLSYENGPAILKEGAFASLMNMMEFFESEIQKKIIGVCINIARTLPFPELFDDYVLTVLPVCVNYLAYRSSEFLKINLGFVEFFYGLCESLVRMFCGEPEQIKIQMELMGDHGLVHNLVELIPFASDSVSGIFRTLKTLCEFSANLSIRFLQAGGAEIIKNIIEGNAKLETVIDTLNLVNACLPNSQASLELENDKIEAYKQHIDLLRALGQMILPQLLGICERVVHKRLKTLALDIIDKLFTYSEIQLVETFATPPSFAALLSDILSSKDLPTVKSTIKIVQVLYEKVPRSISKNFAREGVISRVEELTNPELVNSLISKPSPFEALFSSRTVPIGRTNIRNLLMQSGMASDSQVLDQILSQFRRQRRGGGRTQINRSREPLESESRRRLTDPSIKTEQSADIPSIANDILHKFRDCNSPDYYHLLNELKTIADRLNRGRGESAAEAWNRLIEIMHCHDALTSHEFSQSGIVEAMWRWLTSHSDLGDFNTKVSKDYLIQSKRITEFLTIFCKAGAKGIPHLEKLVKYILQSGRFVQQFNIFLYESANVTNPYFAFRTLTQRVRVKLHYSPVSSEMLDNELYNRHVVFRDMGEIYIELEQHISLDIIRDALEKIKSQPDLDLLRSSIEHYSLDAKLRNARHLPVLRPSVRLQELIRSSEMHLDEEEFLMQNNPQSLLQRMMESSMQSLEEDAENLEERPVPRERSQSSLYPSSIKARMFIDGEEILSGTTIFEIVNRKRSLEDCIQVNFRLEVIDDTEDLMSRYVQGPVDMLRKLVSESEEVGVGASENIYPYLRLLKFIYKLNDNLPYILNPSSVMFEFINSPTEVIPISNATFVSTKLTALLARQLEDPIAITGGGAPQWTRQITRNCAFLFPYQLRNELFQLSWTGARALHNLSDKFKNDANLNIRPPRQKVKIPRENLYDTALRLLSDTNLMKNGMLDLEYENEEGTGQGPTLEFYSLLSKELRSLSVWRNSGEENGLFPAPIIGSQSAAKECFWLMGRLVAKALMDKKQLDLPLSPTFWKLILREPLDMYDLAKVDKQLAKTLLDLQEVVNKRRCIMTQSNLSREQKERHLSMLNFKGLQVQDLALTFTLPGYDSIELKSEGKNTAVTLETLEDYINLVAQYTLSQHIQAEAFRSGMEKLLPVDRLKYFLGDEFEWLTCGEGDDAWKITELKDAIVPAHGYTHSSKTYQNLLTVMTEFLPDDRRNFLQFVTGAPRLPLGGFKALKPPLTVVRKEPSLPSTSPDSYLPSVMTCQNYLKLPDYSSIQVLMQNLKYAITEGHSAFHLS